jgi:hypothetical protein
MLGHRKGAKHETLPAYAGIMVVARWGLVPERREERSSPNDLRVHILWGAVYIDEGRLFFWIKRHKL